MRVNLLIAQPVSKIALVVASIGLAAFSAYGPLGADSWIIWLSLATYYLCFIYLIHRPIRISNDVETYVRADILFMVFYYLIFFLQYQLHVLGLADVSQSRFGFVSQLFPEWSNQAVLLSASGVVAFTLGTLGQFRSAPAHVEGRRETLPGIEWLILIAQLALITLYSLAGWQSAGEGRYAGTASGGALADGVSTLILMFCMISGAVLIVRRRDKQQLNIAMLLSSVFTIYWCYRLLASGDRNSLLLILIVYGAGVATFLRKSGRIFLFSLLAVGLVMYNSIEAIRMSEEINIQSLIEASFSNPETTGPSDASFNITTVSLRASLAAVPSQFDFGLGHYKIVGMLGIVPLIRGYVIGDDWIFTTTSDINTYVLLGPHAVWGVGTNIISDIYIDFGTAAVPILLLLVGNMCRLLVRRTQLHPGSAGVTITYLLFVALVAELPRYAVDFPIRILLWALIIVALYRSVIKIFGFAAKN